MSFIQAAFNLEIAISPMLSTRLTFFNRRYCISIPRNLRYFKRSYQSNANLRPFRDAKWFLERPKFKYLPAKEHHDLNLFEFNLDNTAVNVYTKDPEFKELLDSSMKFTFNEKVTAFTPQEIEAKGLAWLKLRDYLYGQLKNVQSDVRKINESTPSVADIVHPAKPSQVIAQLVNCHKINSGQWQAILNKDSITTNDKFNHIISKTFDFIYEQEILPITAQSPSREGKEVDISNPAEWFPEARKLRREIVMHIGPTNSGKTYKALQKLKGCARGYYAGPLRLLAREIYERFKHEGIRCNLLTGEEVIDDLDEMGNPAGLTAGTVEMVPMSQYFDVVVLDEIQMMSDADRGWAWTNALLGARAREVHLCGEKSILPLVQKIVKMTGDKLVVNEYERLGELKVENSPLQNGLRGLRKGDCVVAFSKKRILDLKLKIEKDTNLKVAVVYGSLPPETRIQQANLFNSGAYDVLVASDAVGMGLNLSIERVIFTTYMKYNGQEMVELSSSNIKQIGGRSGRFKVAPTSGGNGNKKQASVGYVTGVSSEVLQAVKKGISSPIEYLPTAVVWPTDEICGKIMTQCAPGTQVTTLLETFALEVEKKSQKLFTLPELKSRLSNISMFEHMEEIPFFEKLRLSNAPVKDSPMVKKAFVQFCETIAQRQTRSLLSYPLPFDILDVRCIDDEKLTLEYYEALHNIIMVYFWLSNRYSTYFIDQESAHDLKNFCEMIIFEKLDRLKKNPYARRGPPGATMGSLYKNKPKFLKKNRIS